jgi:peptidoglycan lytic transglycosylase
MSVSDPISLFCGIGFGARLARGGGAAMLATCIVCITAGDGNAASNSAAAISAIPFLSSASATGLDEAAATPFASRFDCPQTSVIRDIRDILENPIYQAALTQFTTAGLPHQQKIVPAAPAIVGTASMYNPNDLTDRDSGDSETASGEQYDAEGWTAAIRVDLREQFGGVRFGSNYQPVFALVQSGDKQAIIRINDIGPLKPGRIIDLNERTMRYFDPTLQLGLIDNVSVTPLAGQDWALGPIDDSQPVSVASRFDQ